MMTTGSVLFVGGSGVVGSRTTRLFRQRHRHVPILIGGRRLENAQAIAAAMSTANAISVDTSKPCLGVPNAVALSAVVMIVPDEGLQGLALAQARGVPYLSIGNWLAEVGAEMAHFMQRPEAAPVVLASHWHGGTAVFLSKVVAAGMDKVHAIDIKAIVDERDATGPAAIADMERGGEGGMGVLAFRDGRRIWLSGNETRRVVETLDGRKLEADAFAPYDVVSLHASTGARDIRFDLASGVSSSRFQGGDMSTELIVDIEGEVGGATLRRRATIEFTKGQAVLTGVSVVLTLSMALGLEGRPAASPGLYFPEQLVDAEWFIDELIRAGATVNI